MPKMVGRNINNHVNIECATKSFDNVKLDVMNLLYFLLFAFYTDSPCYNPNPCVNGGTCIVVNDETYECECDPGYNGDNCENSKIQITILHHTLFDIFK